MTTEQDYLEDNIATLAFHMGRDGTRLSVTNDANRLSGLLVDPGEVLKEASRRLGRPVQLQPQWQPIETAPKDGTRILVWFKNPDLEPRYTLVKWDNGWRIGSFNGRGYILSPDCPPEGWCHFTPPAFPSTPSGPELSSPASPYCALCDLEHDLHEDAKGFHHVIKGERVLCPAPESSR